jgi:hypothetical protein
MIEEIRQAPALLVAACFLVLANPAFSQQARTVPVAFPPGEYSTVLEGRITGREVIDYVLRVEAGQVVSVDMQTTNVSNTFNILPPGSEAATYIGSSDGNVAQLTLPEAGDYVIRVYLVRAAARRDEEAEYNLYIGVNPPDFADGLAGGPDYWRVAGLAAGGNLNVRSGPRTVYPVKGKLQNGETVQNRGCRMSGESRWCEIRASGSGLSGWVSGQYLVEGSAPRKPVMPEGGPAGNGMPFDAIGSVPCATARGQPTHACLYGVIREGPGNAGVWVATGDGEERHILFENNVPVTSDQGAEISYEKEVDLFLIRIGPERYEIPGAVINGG